MPPIHIPAKVLVTGASGFIGSWVVRHLLERDYYVRATVRSHEKGEYLKQLFHVYEGAFEYVVVENSAEEGAFDHALNGIDAVEHVVSPHCNEPDGFITAATRGATALLQSVLKHGRSVKRVVMTSSGAALMEPREPGHVYTEADWNLYSVKETELKGASASPIQKYRASKTLAERAAWDFVDKHRGEMKWDLVTVLPTIVYGPIIHQVQSFEQLNPSNQLLYSSILQERSPADVGGNWVDVRDVAEIHVDLLEKRSAGGQRYIASAGMHSWQDLYDTLNASVLPLPDIPQGHPGNRIRGRPPYFFSSEKVMRLTGIQFKSLGETARDTIDSIREHSI